MLRRLFKPVFHGHYRLERHTMGLAVAIIAAASVGGLVEIVPLFTIDETVEEAPGMRVYTPLEQAGRDIYMREGCYACHSQMVRTLRDEVERYGPYSLAVESRYDHPMLWGSKRTGPDLARIGGKYSDEWHVAHLLDPRQVVAQSNMPGYPWLSANLLNTDTLPDRLAALRAVGVPYDAAMIENAARDARGQSMPDTAWSDGVIERYGEETAVSAFDNDPGRLTEMDALVAYLQILGRLVDPVELIEQEALEEETAALQAPAAGATDAAAVQDGASDAGAGPGAGAPRATLPVAAARQAATPPAVAAPADRPVPLTPVAVTQDASAQPGPGQEADR